MARNFAVRVTDVGRHLARGDPSTERNGSSLGSDLGNTLVRDIIARATLVLIMGVPMRGIAAPLLFAYQ